MRVRVLQVSGPPVFFSYLSRNVPHQEEPAARGARQPFGQRLYPHLSFTFRVLEYSAPVPVCGQDFYLQQTVTTSELFALYYTAIVQVRNVNTEST